MFEAIFITPFSEQGCCAIRFRWGSLQINIFQCRTIWRKNRFQKIIHISLRSIRNNIIFLIFEIESLNDALTHSRNHFAGLVNPFASKLTTLPSIKPLYHRFSPQGHLLAPHPGGVVFVQILATPESQASSKVNVTRFSEPEFLREQN